MKLKKSQLKEAIKMVVRECLNERCGGGKGHLAGGKKGERMFKHIKAGYKGEKDPETAERIAAATVNKQLGKEQNEQVGADVVADEQEQEECGSMDERKGKKNWIQKAVKHPGRCANMGGPECPEGSPQYNLAKRFKKGDIHKANVGKEEQDEAGLTSEDDEHEDEHHKYDESEEIKLIRVMSHIAKKLETMHKGMKEDSLDEASYKVVDPHAYEDQKLDKARSIQTDPEVNEDKEYAAASNNCCPRCGTALADKDGRLHCDNPDCMHSRRCHTFKRYVTPKEPKVRENYRVQTRSYVTVKDNPNDPNVMRDPENPQSNGA